MVDIVSHIIDLENESKKLNDYFTYKNKLNNFIFEKGDIIILNLVNIKPKNVMKEEVNYEVKSLKDIFKTISSNKNYSLHHISFIYNTQVIKYDKLERRDAIQVIFYKKDIIKISKPETNKNLFIYDNNNLKNRIKTKIPKINIEHGIIRNNYFVIKDTFDNSLFKINICFCSFDFNILKKPYNLLFYYRDKAFNEFINTKDIDIDIIVGMTGANSRNYKPIINPIYEERDINDINQNQNHNHNHNTYAFFKLFFKEGYYTIRNNTNVDKVEIYTTSITHKYEQIKNIEKNIEKNIIMEL